jgi:hypothetical protein
MGSYAEFMNAPGAAGRAILRPTAAVAGSRRPARIPTVRIVRTASKQGADNPGPFFHFSPWS